MNRPAWDRPMVHPATGELVGRTVAELERIAAHEGAHAVCCVACKIPIESVTIVARPESRDATAGEFFTSGECRTLPVPEEWFVEPLTPEARQGWINRACVTAAGIAAEVIRETGRVHLTVGDQRHLRAIAEMLGAVGDDDGLAFAQSMMNQAASILRSPRGSVLWDRITEELLQKGTLSGPEVVAIAGSVDPISAPAKAPAAAS